MLTSWRMREPICLVVSIEVSMVGVVGVVKNWPDLKYPSRFGVG